jgi:hypothetical protein
MSQYRKTIAAVTGALLTWGTVVTQSPSAPITAAEWIAGGILVATALGVYGVENKG